jgi:outer membrane protein TolC
VAAGGDHEKWIVADDQNCPQILVGVQGLWFARGAAMLKRFDFSSVCRACGHHYSVALALGLLFSGVAAAQAPPSTTSRPLSTRLAIDFRAPADVRRITLRQAQQLAAKVTTPMERLAQLQVDAAEQHRLGVKALYFPNISGQFETLHFNKAPGELLTLQRPLAGTTLSVPVNIIEQSQFAVNFSVVQPITPIFAVRQLVKIARADENIARAKAGLPVTELASLVEKNYFDLLVAERELVAARAETRNVQVSWDTMSTAKSALLATSTVRTLTASLNEILGLPVGTRLELVPPEPFVEHLSLADAIAQATGTSSAVIEAEQTAVKAHAGARLAKMEYFPSIAVLGGYTHQEAINVVLPQDFSYVGVIATYTLFDSFKRERAVKEVALQAEAADLGVELTKAKVAATVKSTYFELERARELARLARGMVPAARVVEASYVAETQQREDAAQAGAEAELLRAERDYRQAYARLQSLMGNP